jgi:hypothetical protein
MPVIIDKNTDRYELDKKLDYYNWDDGFEFPNQIINHPNCELGTALKTFYLAGGELYLRHDLPENDSTKERFDFLQYLYGKIVNCCYIGRYVGFTLPLNKVQKYKLLKAFSDIPTVFIEDIVGSKTAERCEQCFLFDLVYDIYDKFVLCWECNTLSLRIKVEGLTYAVDCTNCGYGVATTCIRPCLINDTTPREEFIKYDKCKFKVL